MRWLVVVLLVVPGLAAAQPGMVSPAQPAAAASPAENLLLAARNAARDGRCDAIPVIAERAKLADPTFYAQQFAPDPELVHCTPHAPRPATVVIGVEASPPPSSVFAPPGMTAPLSVAEVDHTSDAYKSPNMALGLSLGTTAAGLGLMIAGDDAHNGSLSSIGAIAFFAGPTVGQAYAHHTNNGGLWMRVGGAASIVLAASMAIGCWDEPCSNEGAIAIFGYGGMALFGVGTIYEIATAPAAARAYNRRNHLLPASVAIAPMTTRDAAGVALSGRF